MLRNVKFYRLFLFRPIRNVLFAKEVKRPMTIMVIKLLYILKAHFMIKKTRKIPKLENVKMSLTGLKDNQYAV